MPSSHMLAQLVLMMLHVQQLLSTEAKLPAAC
jgi:hypothetical protein